MLYTLIEHTLSTSDSVRYIRTLLGYNKARVLALNKSYWAAINKIFIYARPSVNKMAWVFFFHLSFRPVRLQYSFPSLWNMEETIEELPNFSIGIDLLGPYPTSNKNKAEKKTRKLHVSQICRRTSCSKFWPKDIHWEQKRWPIGHLQNLG